MFVFYLLTFILGRRWSIGEAITVHNALELCDVQSTHNCATTSRKSLTTPLPITGIHHFNKE